ncbi:hypothetical protein P3L10_031115 [Capsicum annuum]
MFTNYTALHYPNAPGNSSCCRMVWIARRAAEHQRLTDELRNSGNDSEGVPYVIVTTHNHASPWTRKFNDTSRLVDQW